MQEQDNSRATQAMLLAYGGLALLAFGAFLMQGSFLVWKVGNILAWGPARGTPWNPLIHAFHMVGTQTPVFKYLCLGFWLAAVLAVDLAGFERRGQSESLRSAARSFAALVGFSFLLILAVVWPLMLAGGRNMSLPMWWQLMTTPIAGKLAHGMPWSARHSWLFWLPAVGLLALARPAWKRLRYWSLPPLLVALVVAGAVTPLGLLGARAYLCAPVITDTVVTLRKTAWLAAGIAPLLLALAWRFGSLRWDFGEEEAP